MRAFAIAILVVTGPAGLAGSAACTKTRALPDEPGDASMPSAMKTALWGELQLHIPSEAETRETHERFDMTRRPHSRSPDTIMLKRSSPEEDAVLRRDAKSTAVLSAGRLAYRIDRHEGGSGGAEASLVGAMVVGGTTYRVECHTQSEYPEPSGDWCLPYLLTIERR